MIRPAPIDLNLLTTLDALLQTGSVAGAARRLGLSAAATSHALARLRDQLQDPILVRAGRAMVLTPRAEGMRDQVHAALADARAVLSPAVPFRAAELQRTFAVHATDHVLTVVGTALDRVLHEEAPGVVVRFLPTAPDDAVPLRDGAADLAVGIYGALPPEMRLRPLFTDRFVCVVRRDHPGVGARLTLEDYTRLEHAQIAPRGQPGGYLDDVLAARGVARRVVRQVPYFLVGLRLIAGSDYVLTVSERAARLLAPELGLRILEPPFELRPYTLSLLWHPRMDGDEAHRFLRHAFVRAAASAAPDAHAAPLTRLDDGPRGRRPRR